MSELGGLTESEGVTVIQMATEDAVVTARDLVRPLVQWLQSTVAGNTGGRVLEG